MNENEIIYGNKLIAKFMDDYDLYHWERDPFNEFLKAKYQAEWRDLMPVLEKIESLGYTSTIHGYGPFLQSYCIIKKGNTRRGYGESNSKIESVWLSIVEFINWYNQE